MRKSFLLSFIQFRDSSANVVSCSNGGTAHRNEQTLPKRAVRINISMDESLISAIDRAASAFGESRSHFLAEAAKLRLGKGDRLV